MSLKKWFKIRRLSTIFLRWGFGMAILHMSAIVIFLASSKAGDNTDFSPLEWYLVAGLSFFGFGSMIISFIHDDFDNYIKSLQSFLDVDDISQYIDLSSSEMEDMCLKRLYVLADELVQAQREHPMPLAKESMRANRWFRQAYWFFEEHECIKPTKWNRFFPQSETQK